MSNSDLDLIQPTGSRIVSTYHTRERLALERPWPHRARTVLIHTIKVTVEWWPGLPQPLVSWTLYGDVLKKDGTPGLQTASWTLWDRNKPITAEEQAALDAALREFRRTFAPILPEHSDPR